MFKRPGPYGQDKARHDLQVLTQLQGELRDCTSRPGPDAAALATELLGLARTWLEELQRDADLSGDLALQAATAAAKGIAARDAHPHADTEGAFADATRLELTLVDLRPTLEQIVAAATIPPSTTADNPADETSIVFECSRATTSPEADRAITGTLSNPALGPTEEPSSELSAVSDFPGIPTFPPLPDADRMVELSNATDRIAAPTFPHAGSSSQIDAESALPHSPTFPALSDEASTVELSDATDQSAPATFPSDVLAGEFQAEQSLPPSSNFPPFHDPSPPVGSPLGSVFAETTTFPPQLDDRLDLQASPPEPASEIALPSPDQDLAPSPADDGLATLSALDELTRQLEQMCPRWGIDTSATITPLGAVLTEPFDTVVPSPPETDPDNTAAIDEPSALATTIEIPAAIALEPPFTPDPEAFYQPAVEPEAAAPSSNPVRAAPSETPLVVDQLVLATTLNSESIAPLQSVADLQPNGAALAAADEPAPAPEPDVPLVVSDSAIAADPSSLEDPAPTNAASVTTEPLPAADPPDPTDPTEPPDPAAVAELTPEQMAALMAGGSAADATAFGGELTPEQMAALMADGMGDAGGSWGSVPIQLEPERLGALQFLVAGVSDHFKNFRTVVWELAVQASREDGSGLLKEAAKKLGQLTGEFDLAALSTIRDLMVRTSDSVCTVPEAGVPELLIRTLALGNLIDQALRGLEVGMEVRWPLDILAERLHLLLRGEILHPDLQGWHNGDVDRLLELDRVAESSMSPPTPESSIAPRGSRFTSNASWIHVFDRRSASGDRRSGGNPVADRRGYGQPTLRVPVRSVDRMASLVADLVVTKNHLLATIDRLTTGTPTAADIEQARSGSADLARHTSGLDVTLTMMQVRLQNISHLFDRFPRVIRDVASIADKNVELVTEPGLVQVEKTMFDALSDPLGQLLRAVVARSIQTPAERAAAGKPAAATITLRAQAKGTRVTISVSHDGRNTPRPELIERVVELEMLTAEQAALRSDDQLLGLEFDEHYCDPDLALVSLGVAALNGEISVQVADGLTTYFITAPLGVAVLDAVMVGVGLERYGIPLANVEEISLVSEADVSSVRGRPVLRRRDGVVGIIDLRRTLGLPEEPASTIKRPGTAVVIRTEHHRAALLVSRVLAKEELVVRSLGAEFAAAKIFSGATISGDGKVNLIVDADRLAEYAHLHAQDDGQ